MKGILGVPGKPSKQPLKYLWMVSIFLGTFWICEFLLQKQLALSTKAISSCLQLEKRNTVVLSTNQLVSSSFATAVPTLVTSPTVHETFNQHNTVYWDNITDFAPKQLLTSIDRSETDDVRSMHYGLSPMRNVCIRPNGTLVVVGTSPDEFTRILVAAGEAMIKEWQETYNCSWGCNGVEFDSETPTGALWIAGRTTHIIPYLGNVIHHFAERVWPHITGFQDLYVPSTLERPIPPVNHYYVHRMHTWLDQAHHNMDRSTLMSQLGILGLLAGPEMKYLQHTEDEIRPLCFEHLTPTCASCGRMSPKLGLEIFGPALDRYRNAAFDYFQIPQPEVAMPPRPIRVTLYGRSDTSRRRITNIADVADYLRSWTQPPLIVTFVDELLQSKYYNQSMPEVASLMAQTDILITAHGANTWATIFMPKRAAVIEIYGPCGPSTWIDRSIVPALQLKHKTEVNPWGDRIASPKAGNTTECNSAHETPDYTIDIAKLDKEIHSLGLPSGPGDRFPLHWLYNWRTNNY